jgi:D-glycero-alpha-D-manno-heptose-7-phosphate kinase
LIISRTPFRISFFGGGTDYPAWYRENGGCVVATAIDKFTYVTCRARSALSSHRWRIVYSREETTDHVEEIVHPPTRACLQMLGETAGLEVHSDADLPARTGLGSSSSYTVGLLHVLHALRGRRPPPRELALQAIRVERELLGEVGGVQDQVLAAFGGFARIDFGGLEEFRVSRLEAPAARLNELTSHLLLFFTGYSRDAVNIAAEQARNLPGRRAELQALQALADEAWRLLHGPSDLSTFGRLLHEGWRLKRRLSARIATPEIDDVYEKLRRSGAVGGKLLGAGGGGFLLVFAPPDRHRDLHEVLPRSHVPFSVSTHGSEILFPGAPTTPAARPDE